jgi:hypothetical protein
MTSESILVAAAFEHPADAEAAVKDLGAAGFGTGDVSVMYTDKSHLAKEGIIEGAAFGGLIGGLVGLFFPPLGMIVAAGPILGSLASGIAGAGTTAIAGAALYGLTNTLVQVGMPKEMAGRFGGHVHKGDTLVVVHTVRDSSDKARGILDAHKPRTAETEQPTEAGAVAMPAQSSSAQAG